MAKQQPPRQPHDASTEGRAEIPDKLYFRIGEVASLVGVDAHVLRYWEKEFQMKAHRSSSGQRLYRKRDLTRFMRIKHLLHDEGYTIAGARRALRRDGDAAPSVDVKRLREALRRLEQLRADLGTLRDELRAPLVNGRDSG